jgi:hypothetical protein
VGLGFELPEDQVLDHYNTGPLGGFPYPPATDFKPPRE